MNKMINKVFLIISFIGINSIYNISYSDFEFQCIIDKMTESIIEDFYKSKNQLNVNNKNNIFKLNQFIKNKEIFEAISCFIVNNKMNYSLIINDIKFFIKEKLKNLLVGKDKKFDCDCKYSDSLEFEIMIDEISDLFYNSIKTLLKKI